MTHGMVSIVPFNVDELAAQRLGGGGAPPGYVRTAMPDQHREFFSLLPYLFVATTDGHGWPVATVLTGQPGFVSSPDAGTLRIAAWPRPDDPAAPGCAAGGPVGILGLDFSTRRRNRANGIIFRAGADGLTVAVRESFGNCPQYIQRRTVNRVSTTPHLVEKLDGLDDDARAAIAKADTFFVGSTARSEAGGGMDISHRGGRPGFVRIEGNTLTIPDFPGNRHFNTLGNLLGEPRAALLFVDFRSGDVLQLQGRAKIDWQAGAVARALRHWQFHVVRGWRRRSALPLRWDFLDYSPATEKTGVWAS